MAPEPAKMRIAYIVQKADRRGSKTNGPTGAIHIPRQTAGAAAERAGCRPLPGGHDLRRSS